MTETWSPTEAAARGAAWLDEHDPGWAVAPIKERGINLKRLNLESCASCVLGQRMAGLVTHPTPALAARAKSMGLDLEAYKSDGYGLATDFAEEIFGEDLKEPVVHQLGFTVPDGLSIATGTAFRQLTAAWRTEIEARRHAPQRAENEAATQ